MSINFGSGTLYYITGDECHEIGKITGIEEANIVKEPVKDDYNLIKSINDFEISLSLFVKDTKKTSLMLSGLYDAILSSCNNKRIIHLVKHGRKERIRKKNLNRIIRMLEKIV